jgi:APA family basic amino acid/polyamine antiporter
MVVFSLVVGIGIFRTPAIVAGAAGSTTLFFTAWILAGVISLIGALTFAEIGSRYPRAGGYYRVVADSYHPTLAFMLNWSQTLMQGAGAAGVAFIGAEYLMPVLLPPQWRTPHASLVLACATMLILLSLNYRGVKPGAHAKPALAAQDRHDHRSRGVGTAARSARIQRGTGSGRALRDCVWHPR